jgi:hypothetical protein
MFLIRGFMLPMRRSAMGRQNSLLHWRRSSAKAERSKSVVAGTWTRRIFAPTAIRTTSTARSIVMARPGRCDAQWRATSDKLLSQRSPRAGSSWRQGLMSTYARLQELPISKTILPRQRRTPELPPLSLSHVPARFRRCSVLSLYAPVSHRARYSRNCLNGRLRAPTMLLRAGSKANRAPCGRATRCLVAGGAPRLISADGVRAWWIGTRQR